MVSLAAGKVRGITLRPVNHFTMIVPIRPGRSPTGPTPIRRACGGIILGAGGYPNDRLPMTEPAASRMRDYELIGEWREHVAMRHREAVSAGLLRPSTLSSQIRVCLPTSLDLSSLADISPNVSLRDLTQVPQATSGWERRADLFDDLAMWIKEHRKSAVGDYIVAYAEYARMGDASLLGLDVVAVEDRVFIRRRIDEIGVEGLAAVFRRTRSRRLLAATGDFPHVPAKAKLFICDVFQADAAVVCELE